MQDDTPPAPLCRIDEVPATGRLLAVTTPDGAAWCVMRDGDDWLAGEAACPHRGRDLALCGVLEDGVLTCLGHLWQWDVRAGGEPLGPSELPLRVIRLRRLGDTLHLPA